MLKQEVNVRSRVYLFIAVGSLVVGALSQFVQGHRDSFLVGYFGEMYPFFFGVALLGALFVIVSKTRGTSLVGIVSYWTCMLMTAGAWAALCIVGIFANPVNWKNYSYYSYSDVFWLAFSNAAIVIASVYLAGLVIRELTKARGRRG